MQHRRAFALRDSIDATTFGGSFAMPDGSTFRVDDALRETGGVIVTDNPALIDALGAYPALKSVAVPKEHAGYDGMTKDQLEAIVAERAVPVDPGATKKQLVDALLADDQRIADEQNATDAAAAEASVANVDGGESEGER